MRFGTKKSDIQEPGNYLRNFKKGETKVRFLTEPGDFHGFREHYIKQDGGSKSFPCTGERDSCPGCTHPNEDVQKANRKYGAPVLLVETGRVLPMRIPVKLVDSLQLRADRNNGTITDRDFVVYRSGSQFDTTYDLDTDKSYPVDIKALLRDAGDEINIEAILQESFEVLWGDPEQYLAPEAPPEPVKPKVAKPPRNVDEQIEQWRKEEQALDVPPTKPLTQSDSAVSEVDEELDEETVRAMTLPELVSLYERASIPLPNTADISELASHLIDALN